MIDVHAIETVAQRIGEAANAERVVLFGSHARGNASEHSDVDLLVIADSELPRFKRSRALYGVVRPHPFAMDLIVYTPAEVERDLRSNASFVSAALRGGVVVYGR
jgi:predicted nucleotidyltransferase